MADTEGASGKISFDGLDSAIDAVGRLISLLWDKSPALVWFCVIMGFASVLYHIHCKGMRDEEKRIDYEIPQRKRVGSKKSKSSKGAKRHA